MSVQLISKYYAEVEKVIRYGGSTNETAVRNAFQNLLNDYARQQSLLLIGELEYKTPAGRIVIPDGTLKDALRLDWGYWESKDTDDDLEQEIVKKFRKGYPAGNILFEDGRTAILYQKGDRVNQCAVDDPERLHILLMQFVTFTRAEVYHFRDAIEQFKDDLPQVLQTLRGMIEQQANTNKDFVAAREDFLEVCQTVINADVVQDDVNEMLIQHILTEEIFTTVFDDPQFHTENNISKELQKLEKTFFTGKTKRDTLDAIKGYYQIIKARAAEIANHTEKQKFLKIVYETFYKAYSPKNADRLGIVYTPDEIVTFMIESADVLLYRHFHKTLGSKNVEILDPATGTGTFICDLIDYLPESALPYKYKNEIHCNEVAILPYYIANLNIEATYKQKMGVYEEFKNICFVDTLDNVHALRFGHKQDELFSITVENANRVKRQNSKKISVIIGNPPYNAKQENYNYQNANRFYKMIDERIRNTYVKEGKAQNQITLFDMYVRFVRWASDRIDKNGVIALITNRSYLDSMAFDGFRRCVQQEFDEIYIVDTRSDVRANPKISGTKYNVFGIQTGVAVMFLVKKQSAKQNASIHYFTLQDEQTRKDKLAFFSAAQFSDLPFEQITPDKHNNWLNLTDNDYDDLLPLFTKDTKSGMTKNALFKVFSSGLETKKDEWAYDSDCVSLANKMHFFIDIYKKTLNDSDFKGKYLVKWDRELDRRRNSGTKIEFQEEAIVKCLYRPFVTKWLYFDKDINAMSFRWPYIYSTSKKNLFIALNGTGNTKPFHLTACDRIIDRHCTGDSQVLPFNYFDKDGQPVENITDWALNQFRAHYKNKEIGKRDIFYYVYGVLHNPAYRKKYAQNLKRQFPRIPFYDDFGQWRNWGKRLMELHVGYETANPFGLKRIERKGKKMNTPSPLRETPPCQGESSQGHQLPRADRANEAPKPRLKADKEKGLIEIDAVTSLTGVPKDAWGYMLGNRSAIEWVLEQYKETKLKDPTLRERFDTYRLVDYKDDVIALVQKVVTVSVETMKIVDKMKQS